MQPNLFELDEKMDKERSKKKNEKPIVKYTKYKSRTPLNKTINKDGTKYSNAYFTDGNFTTHEISNMIELKKQLLKISKYEAIGLGVHKTNNTGEIVPKSRSKELARSKENFKWNDTYNLVMLDYDYFDGLFDIKNPLEFQNNLVKIDSSFLNVQLLISPSTSSLVIKKDNKENLYKRGGFHCYFIIKGSVERFRELLWQSCWAKGYGAIKLAADGSILSRTIFDNAVLSPERLVFEALPDVDDSLALRKRDIKIFNTKGSYLNVDDMESNISAGLKAESDAKFMAKSSSIELKEIYITKHAKKLIEKSNVSLETARKIIEAKTSNSGIIYENDMVYFPSGESIKAGDLTIEHDGQYILDPIEPNQANAVLNVTVSGRKTIHSFLHGGKNFEIIPADLDVKLDVKKEAKIIAQNFLKEIWNDRFGYGYSEKMYENWEIMFQSYLEASKDSFDKMFVISTSAGSAKTTSLAYFLRNKIIETKGAFTALVVVNTIQNGIDFKRFLNEELLDIDDPEQKLVRAKIMFAKDKEIIEDNEGNKLEYTSDVNHSNCIDANILIITHSRLRKAVLSNKTEYLMSSKLKESLILENRNLIVIDEAIDFEEKATIKQSQSHSINGQLLGIRTSVSNESKAKIDFLSSIITKFTDFCKSIETNTEISTIKIHLANEIFGDIDINQFPNDENFINEILSKYNLSGVNLESYITDLSILIKSRFFHLKTGHDGVIISSNIDRIPNKGFIVLDASAVINHEYQHYISKQKAQRIRVHLDAKRYDEVTIYHSEEDAGVGKIDVPNFLINPDFKKSNFNINDKKDLVKKIESFKNKIQIEILSKTTKEDKILIISNKSLDEYLRTHLILDRTYHSEHWGNLTGRNDLKDCNKVFCLTLPYKPTHYYYSKAYKHNLAENKNEVSKFKISNLLDEVYQALMRANLRTNDPITKNAPKCDIYIRTSIGNYQISDSQKLISTLENMLIGSKVSKWIFEGEKENEYNKMPDKVFQMRDVLTEWVKNNPHSLYIEYKTLSNIYSSVFSINGRTLRQYKNIYIGDNVTVLNWLESQTGLKFLEGNESKAYLFEKHNIPLKGRGVSCFCKKI